MIKNYLLLFSILFSVFSKAQILNAYAKITAVDGTKTILTVANVNQASHTFTVGGQVIVMQMQDDVIGTNTTNIASFGDLGNIANAGVYEIGIIKSRTPASGTPTSITLASALGTNFNINANSSVQLISFRDLGLNYTTAANITGLAWNGNVGGVIAISVTNTLTLNHSINADGIGFRGGNVNPTTYENACTPNLYITNSNRQALKGEGIYKSTDANFTNARGKILTGGGGGNDDNGGGGGGGNYTFGGDGGYGWGCNATTNSGGIGGIPLASHISASRIFMGGGGGGGQENNGLGTDGGNGGGIILLKTTTLKTSTSCTSKITANGEKTSNSGNDGAGGAGAGGTIVLQVTSYSLNPSCTFTIASNGGNGGTVGNSGSHGGGAGGGQGAVIFPVTQPTVNVTVTTIAGTGGGNNNTGSGTTAGSGGGPNNAGIVTNASGPLPVELISFTGTSEGTHNSIIWQSAVESNFKHYELESAEDGINFTKIATINPIGNQTSINNYNYLDFNYHKPISYYRLKMVDLDYTFKYSNITAVEYGKELSNDIVVYPNPAADELYISVTSAKQGNATLTIYDIYGRAVHQKNIDLVNKFEKTSINTSDFASGTYIVNIVYENGSNENIKVIINHNN